LPDMFTTAGMTGSMIGSNVGTPGIGDSGVTPTAIDGPCVVAAGR